MKNRSEANPVALATSQTQPADCTREELAHDRYLDALHDLVEDAAAGGNIRELADVVAWTFARIAIGCGPGATGDMLGLVGKYMTGIHTQKQAERELERERQEGRLPN
jgi:hypothetical protein